MIIIISDSSKIRSMRVFHHSEYWVTWQSPLIVMKARVAVDNQA